MDHNEQDIQRFLQIREEIHNEIKKIEPNVLLLQEVTNRFVTHFGVFEKLSQNAQEQIKSAIKHTSYEIAALVAEELSKRIEDQIQSILESLDESVHKAKNIFESISKKNMVKIVSILSLLILLSFSIGFSSYFYPQVQVKYLKGIKKEAKEWRMDREFQVVIP